MRSLRARLTPYWLALPGGLWLAIFFIVPIAFMLSLSLQTGDAITGYSQTFNWSVYWDNISLYQTQFIRSIFYALIVTVLALFIAYPVAYWLAFRAGSRKTTFLLIILLPFFVSFVIRTLSWQFILSDNGIVLGPLKDIGLLPDDFHVLATSVAVIAGLTYNFLPFMILPLYVALERIDPKLIEAANDLYASPVTAFRKVVLPLSLPGVFAGVLITFVPVASDYVNAALLGGTNNTMIGNIIQTLYLTNGDYPTGSALSFTLMGALLIGIFAYARVLGTEDVMRSARA